MILGADHLALSALDTDAAVAQLQAQGYREQFVERGVTNAEAKRPLLSHWQPRHELALLRATDGGPAIEVVNHGAIAGDRHGPYSLVDGEVVLATADPAAEEAFWCAAMGFRPRAEGGLQLVSPVPGWGLRLRLEEAPADPDYPLDAEGYTCLALLSRGIAADLEKAAAHGASGVSDIFELSVNQRRLRIAMLRSPGGALCELIDPS